MKDVYLKFYETGIQVVKTNSYNMEGTYFSDRESIENSLELIRNVIKDQKILYHSTFHSVSSTYLVDYRLSGTFHFCIGRNRHTLSTEKDNSVFIDEVDSSFGLEIMDDLIKGILS